MRPIALPALLAAAALCGAARAESPAPPPETISFGLFGRVTLHHATPRPPHVVLLFADGGAPEIAARLAALDALVVACDMGQFVPRLASLSSPCGYPAGDAQEMSQFVEQKLGYPDYVTPIVVGAGRGTALAYAVLAEAPANTFLGGVSLEFCPRVTLPRPLCKGDGLAFHRGGEAYRLLPDETLPVPWIATLPPARAPCGAAEVDSFVARVPGARLGGTLEEAMARIIATQPPAETAAVPALDDLPLVEVPAPPDAPATDLLAVQLSGDGGWSITDKGLASLLAERGIPVVGLNTLRYFWQARTPEEAGLDLGRILDHYLAIWRRAGIALVGYSFGADVLPFMIERLSPAMRARVRLVALLGPSRDVRFQFHFGQWMGRGGGEDVLPTLPEVEKLKDLNVLCLYGDKEDDSLCRELDPTRFHRVERAGGHRILWSYKPVAAAVLQALGDSLRGGN